MEDHRLGRDTLVSPRMAQAMNRWRRAFYGIPGSKGSHPTRLAAAITGYLSVLVTAELSIAITGGERGELLAQGLETVNMQRAVQLAARSGQCVLRPRVEDGALQIDLIPGENIFPTRLDAAGRPVAGYFADYRTREGESLVRLESFDYRKGTLTMGNRAYLLEGDQLGREIPLDTLAQWAELAPETVVQGVSGPLFGVIQMPFLGGDDPTSPLPVSLYADALESLEEFDRLYGELLYELHSGKRKRIIERQALPSLTGKRFPGTPDFAELSTDTYLVLDPLEEKNPFSDYSPTLRTEGYLTGLKNLLYLIENQCHLSPGAMSLETGGAITATEVVSRDRTTYHTCAAIQSRGLRPGILALLRGMDALCQLYALTPPGEYQVTIAFGDGVFEDTGAEFSRRMQMVQQGILKPEQLLSWYFGVSPAAAEALTVKGGV